MRTFRCDAARITTALFTAALISACSEATLTSPAQDGFLIPPDVAARLDVTPSPVDVIVRVGDPGEFTNAIAPSNQKRITGAFWDNFSADTTKNAPNCNVGFYAKGTISADCLNQSAGSYTNRGGGYDRYFGDGPDDRDAAGFRFDGSYTYTVTLKASYAGSDSEVGWYTYDGVKYEFYPVTAWGTGNVAGVPITINTGGLDWGFYITNSFNDELGGCRALTSCTDATGGFTIMPKQQFALMLNTKNSTYLVGVEDNKLELLTPPLTRDSDYQDYVFSVVPKAIPEVCDFITFGRLVTEVNGQKVVISGNAGGNAPGGGILGEFHIDVDGTDYHVSDIDTYGPILSGALSTYENSRIVTGIAKNGATVELRLWDGGEPGKGTDRAYIKIGGTERFGVDGQLIDQGNMQYHSNCRGPNG